VRLRGCQLKIINHFAKAINEDERTAMTLMKRIL
jgi:hypothetical protein